MLSDLLISSQATMAIVIVALCVFAIAVILYGVFKKFNQMGWLPWQIIIIFFATMLCDLMPVTLAPDIRLWLNVVILLVITGLVLGAGEAIRHRMLVQTRPAPLLLRVCNRVLGGITGVLGLGVLVAALAGFALPLCEYAIPPAQDLLATFFESSFWESVSGYLLDFFVVAVLVSCFNAGYRIGLGRGLLTIFMCLFTLASVAISLVLTLGVPALSGFGGGLAKAMNGTPVVSAIAGYGIAFLLWFILFFTVFALLGFLIHKLIRKIRFVRPLGILGGILSAIIFFMLMLLLAFGVDALVAFLADGGLREALAESGNAELVSSVEEALIGVRDAFMSSPISRAIYMGNPFKALLP